MKLEEARALPLMGRPESWSGHGRVPLDDCPDTVLRMARAFFRKIYREEKSQRVEEQLEAIELILADHEANSPQQQLAL
jgi:hypothetical protein